MKRVDDNKKKLIRFNRGRLFDGYIRYRSRFYDADRSVYRSV